MTIYALLVLLSTARVFSGVQAIHANNETQADRVSSTGVGIATGSNNARLGIPVRMDVLKRLEIPGDPTNPVSVPVIRRIQVGPRNPAVEDFRSPGGLTLTDTRLDNQRLGRNPNSMSRFPIPIQDGRGPLRPDLVQHGGDSSFLEGRRVSGAGSDVPGQRGNISPNPSVHRELTGEGGFAERHVPFREQTVSVPNDGFVRIRSLSEFEHHESPSSGIGQPIGFQREHSGSSGQTHVDLPGEHGNESPFPVVHRASEERGKVHVDLPGQHGNNSPHPVLHRESDGQSDGRPSQRSTDVHADMPGQHLNLSPYPVVHRDTSGRILNVPLQTDTDLQVDLPRRLGNLAPNPGVHRERSAAGALSGSPSGFSRLPTQTGERSTQSFHGRSVDTSRQFLGDFGMGDRFFGPQMFDRVERFPTMPRRIPMGLFSPGFVDRIPLPPPFLRFDRPFGFFRREFMPGGHFHHGELMGPMFMGPFHPFRGFP
ncbi:hypothetical protein DPMN_103935 [Dreissena polymorpha]|uniref:Uncharacterized protein n=1 Tax=Dreissena polymorpha TaxID=45954 RepID=A0A9D4K179_DREPO|nr:hypothetical protein DPMN_103935 [Dreissena polymorpha]